MAVFKFWLLLTRHTYVYIYAGGVNNYSGYEVPAGSYASHSAVGNSASIVYAVPAEDGGNGDIVDNGLSSDYSNANLTSLPLPDATQSATDIDETYGDINRTRTHSTTAGARGAVIRNNNGTDGRGAAARSSDSYAATSKGVAIDNAVLHQGLIFYKRATAALVAVSLVLLAIVLLLATRNSGGSCTTELVHGGGVAGAAAADLLAEASSDADRDHPLCGPSKAEIQCLRWLQDVVGTTNDDNNVDSNINDDKVVESSIESVSKTLSERHISDSAQHSWYDPLSHGTIKPINTPVVKLRLSGHHHYTLAM